MSEPVKLVENLVDARRRLKATEIALAIAFAALVAIFFVYSQDKKRGQQSTAASPPIVEPQIIDNLTASLLVPAPTPAPEYWLRVWNRSDNAPASGAPGPGEIYLTSRFKPIVKRAANYWRVEFQGGRP